MKVMVRRLKKLKETLLLDFLMFSIGREEVTGAATVRNVEIRRAQNAARIAVAANEIGI